MVKMANILIDGKPHRVMAGLIHHDRLVKLSGRSYTDASSYIVGYADERGVYMSDGALPQDGMIDVKDGDSFCVFPNATYAQ